MSKIYDKLTEAEPLLAEIITQSRPDLEPVKIAITLVSKLGPEDELVPCLKLRGTNCVACIKVTRAQQRIYLNHEAEILIDNYYWRDFDLASRRAVLHHEVTHLVVPKDKHGKIKLDDSGKPRLRIKPDDFSVTGFYSTIRFCGTNAIEFSALRKVYSDANAALDTNLGVPEDPALQDSAPVAGQT